MWPRRSSSSAAGAAPDRRHPDRARGDRRLPDDRDVVRVFLPCSGRGANRPVLWTRGEGTFSQDLFFSFTTLTTTGYGNLVPAANPGLTCVLEMLIGQLFLVTAVAKVVSTWRPSPGRGRPPTEDQQLLGGMVPATIAARHGPSCPKAMRG